MGLICNLSLQGRCIESALRLVAHEVAPGTLLTVAFVLPSGRPCKLCAIVIHGDCRGCGVQFLEGLPNRSLIFRAIRTPWRSWDGEAGRGEQQGCVVHIIHFPLRLSLLVYLFSHAYTSKNMGDTALPAPVGCGLFIVSGSPQLVIALFFVVEDAHTFTDQKNAPGL